MPAQPRIQAVYASFSGSLPESGTWYYLGQNTQRRNDFSKRLGSSVRGDIRRLLTEAAETLRQPFLDFCADLGRVQPGNRLNWWAGRFASRNPRQSDFFILLCYVAVFDKLVQETGSAMVVIVEDPWLWDQLHSRYRENSTISFLGRSSRVWTTFLWCLQGVAARLLAVGQLVSSHVQTVLARGQEPLATGATQFAAAIHTYAEPRALKTQGRFADFYTGGLDALLKKDAMPILRVLHFPSPVKTTLKDLRPLREMKDFIWPLIFELGWRDYFAALGQRWHPQVSASQSFQIQGHPVRLLWEREILDEWRRTWFTKTVLFYQAARKFFSRRLCPSYVYLYENQPWEKMLCLAARQASDIKLYGYQHSTIPRFHLSYAHGKGEADFIPLPDRVFTTGELNRQRMQEGGFPAERLAIGGAWRYTQLDTEKPVRDSGADKEVAVIFPIDSLRGEELLQEVLESTRRLGPAWHFSLKIHPLSLHNTLAAVPEALKKQIGLTYASIRDLTKTAHRIIATGTTAGLEAALSGACVIRYRPQAILDIDPLEALPRDFFTECGSDLAETLSAPCRTCSISTEQRRTAALDLFAPVQESVWRKVVFS